jgi:transcription initiation factor IIE alpha subunit
MESIAHKPKTFEERVDARRARVLAANRHRVFRCIECGEKYSYDWVYEYGMVCTAGCDGELVEVRNG